MSDDVVISNDCIKRIIKDVKNIYKNPLNENGIYYKHDEENLLKGYAMIVGPKDTPYEDGFYFFNLSFSNDYPYKPPVVTFMKNPYNIRFHPNFYRNGKVCLSILNTWRGEQWTSCQNISSILLTMCSVMNSYPLTNEPGININHKDNCGFNKIITFQNYNFSLIDVLNKDNIDINFISNFEDDIIEVFKHNEKNISKKLDELKNKYANSFIQNTNIYSMSINIDYNKLLEKYNILKNKYINCKN